jgi:hypothetical protein
MRLYGAKSVAKWVLVAALALGSGCASRAVLQMPSAPQGSVEPILHGFLDRSDKWLSLGARVKLKLTIRGEKGKARGYVLYIGGERYKVGFADPYRHLLGDFYVTPTEVIYWDARGVARTLTIRDTTRLENLIPLSLPNWDPRDLLPFVSGGRTGGLQVDSMQRQGDEISAYASDELSSHVFVMDQRTSSPKQEWIRRPGRELMIKRFSKISRQNGWPIPTRIICSDSLNTTTLEWTLSDLVLRSETRLGGFAQP